MIDKVAGVAANASAEFSVELNLTALLVVVRTVSTPSVTATLATSP